MRMWIAVNSPYIRLRYNLLNFDVVGTGFAERSLRVATLHIAAVVHVYSYGRADHRVHRRVPTCPTLRGLESIEALRDRRARGPLDDVAAGDACIATQCMDHGFG